MPTYQDALKRKLGQGHNAGPKKGLPKRGNLHFPKPDPDPKAPNEPKKHQGQQANVRNKPKQRKPGQQGNGNSGSSSTGGGGGQGGGGNQGNGFLPATDPRDDQYWRDVFTLQQERDLKLQNLDVEETYAKNSFNEAALNLKLQQPKDILNFREGANRGGSFYSSRTGEGVGDITKDYFQMGSQLNRDFESSNASRQIERDLISQGFNREQAALLASATDRASQAEQDRPMPEADSYAQALLDRLGRGGGGSNQGGGNRGAVNQSNQNRDKDKKKNKPKGKGKGK
jgi:hypothetical protein